MAFEHNKRIRWWFKKIFFALIRAKQEIAYYEASHSSFAEPLKVCHIGSAVRGDDFVRRLFGEQPQRRSVGKCMVFANMKQIERLAQDCDILIVEINRLFSETYRKSGYLTIPEWVEFGRKVITDPSLRYAGATRSLKSDLNGVRRSSYNMSTSQRAKDFDFFYNKMYLPHAEGRFGSQQIIKTRRHMKNIFDSGFILFLKEGSDPIAGALIKIEGQTVTETAIGIREGSERILKKGVSGELDFHLHQWAADHDMHTINVGHTRPFPTDGVYFNKRKWMMSIMPDHDGVMNMALNLRLNSPQVVLLLKDSPIIVQADRGLDLIWASDSQQPLSVKEVKGIWKRYWASGLNRIIGLAPNGLCPDAVAYAEAEFGTQFRWFSTLDEMTNYCRCPQLNYL